MAPIRGAALGKTLCKGIIDGKDVDITDGAITGGPSVGATVLGLTVGLLKGKDDVGCEEDDMDGLIDSILEGYRDGSIEGSAIGRIVDPQKGSK